MPVIVVGADHPKGTAIVEALRTRQGEIRVFISDPAMFDHMKEAGFKVALGDLSDASHIGGAALNCFSAVLVADAARDGREIAFADSPDAVYEGWSEAMRDGGVNRIIWVGGQQAPRPPTALADVAKELAVVAPDLDLETLGGEVVRLDDLASI